MDFKIISKLKYEMVKVVHIGAHKFEEASDYKSFGTREVLWIDPFPQADPEKLPAGQRFLQIAVDDVQISGERDFVTYEATGFSSFFNLQKPGSIVRGTPIKSQTTRVTVRSLRDIQVEHDLNAFTTLVIDTQGSEYAILKSANLKYIKEIIVETSKVPLYQNEASHEAINSFLLKEGFIHNLNDSDLFYGHGDQYYSREERTLRCMQVKRRIIQSIRFLKSFLSRIKVGILMRLR